MQSRSHLSWVASPQAYDMTCDVFPLVVIPVLHAPAMQRVHTHISQVSANSQSVTTHVHEVILDQLICPIGPAAEQRGRKGPVQIGQAWPRAAELPADLRLMNNNKYFYFLKPLCLGGLLGNS